MTESKCLLRRIGVDAFLCWFLPWRARWMRKPQEHEPLIQVGPRGSWTPTVAGPSGASTSATSSQSASAWAFGTAYHDREIIRVADDPVVGPRRSCGASLAAIWCHDRPWHRNAHPAPTNAMLASSGDARYLLVACRTPSPQPALPRTIMPALRKDLTRARTRLSATRRPRTRSKNRRMRQLVEKHAVMSASNTQLIIPGSRRRGSQRFAFLGPALRGGKP